MIIDAVIPLLLEHGKDVTSKQIAEAAGIAEGTIFRAFGNKDSLITAAVAAFMNGRNRPDLEPRIDPRAPLDDKLAALVEGMRHRVRDIMRMAAITGRRGPSPSAQQQERFNAMIAATFAGNESELRVSPEKLGDYVRMLAIASSIPLDTRQFSNDEILDFLKHGIVESSN